MKLPKYSLRTLVAAMAIAGFLSWLFFVRLDPMYGFSREQFDQGYVTAFKMNGCGRGHIDYKQEFGSAQIGFDEGLNDFGKIYEHPNVGPFSYSWAERLREVIQHIRESNEVKKHLKKQILAEMEEQLKQMEEVDLYGPKGDRG